MNNLYKRSFIGMLALAFFAAALSPLSVQAGSPKTEDQLIADMASPKDKVVIAALQQAEKNYPASPKILSAIRNLLADPRVPVLRKAARVLGAVNADVSDTDIQNISKLLMSADADTIIDGLKALRGLKAQSAIPQILPLLKNSNKNVMRDAMRTLAVLGDSSLIPDIKPLLTYPDLAVQKDAADAISILKEK